MAEGEAAEDGTGVDGTVVVERDPDFASARVSEFCRSLPKPGMAVAVLELCRTGYKKLAAAAAGVSIDTLDNWCGLYEIERAALEEAIARKLRADRMLLALDQELAEVIARAARGEAVPPMQLAIAVKTREQNERVIERMRSMHTNTPMPPQTPMMRGHAPAALSAPKDSPAIAPGVSERAAYLRKKYSNAGRQGGGRR